MPTPTLEEYLEAIYKLSRKGEVRPTQIAEAVGVSGPTITATLRRLAAQGFTTRDGNVISLSERGLSTAIDIVRRHRIAERFLVDMLGLDLNEAHEDACLLEHALSPRVLEALERVLNSPEVCPHGHPIPASDGTVAAVVGRPLSTLSAGESAVVVQIAEDDDAVLSYLTGLGLSPGRPVTVLEVAPFGGPLLVRIADNACAIGRDVAALVLTGQR